MKQVIEQLVGLHATNPSMIRQISLHCTDQVFVGARPCILENSLYYVRTFRTPEIKAVNTVTVNKFRDNLREHVETVISRHQPLKVTRRNGEDFVVMSMEDWEREQETLHVLENESLMAQIARSAETHAASTGYRPTPEQMDEIDRL